MVIKVLKRKDFLETSCMGYGLQYNGNYESGKLITNVVDENSYLIKIVQSWKRKINDEERWITYLFNPEEQKVDMTWQPYDVDQEKDIIKKKIGNKQFNSIRKHEEVLTVLLKDLNGLPLAEQKH